MRREHGTVLIGTGGFVSAPGVLGARLSGVPVLLLEPNATSGVANRWLSRVAGAAALAHQETADELRCRSEVTGVPVRSAFFEQAPMSQGKEQLDVLVLGGSQGARELNRQLPGLFRSAAEGASRSFRVVHQTGAGGLDAARSEYGSAWTVAGEFEFSAPGIHVSLVPFIDDMPVALAAADLVLSRAGAVTLAELCAVGRASVLIPLPIAAGHQGANAKALCDAGAATMIAEGDLADAKSVKQLAELLSDEDRLRTMGAAAKALGRSDAAARIADLAVSLAGGVSSWR